MCIHNPTSCFLCSTKRGGDGLSHLLPHPDALSREECTVRINRLRSRMRPRFTISLINGNYPKLTKCFPLPHPALADMKNPGEASVFFYHQQQPQRQPGLDVGCWMLDVCLRDFISPLAVRSDRNRVPPRRNRCPPNHVGNLNQFL